MGGCVANRVAGWGALAGVPGLCRGLWERGRVCRRYRSLAAACRSVSGGPLVLRKGWGGAVWKVLWASRGRAGGGAGCSPFGEGDAGLGRVRLGVRGWVVCGGALKVALLWCLVQVAVAGRASLGKSLRWVRKGSFVTGNAVQERVTAGWRGRQGQGSRCQGARHGGWSR